MERVRECLFPAREGVRSSNLDDGKATVMSRLSWKHRSYEELPALAVRRGELRSYLRTITVAWMYGIIWMTCIRGSRMANFGTMLGFQDIHFGLLAALPFIAKFGQLVAAILIERTGLKKYQFLQCATVHRALWLVVAGVPLLAMIPGIPALPARWAVWSVLVVLTMSWLSDSLAAPAWQTWMSDVIPRRIRGRYFATRSRLTQMIQLPVVIALAVIADLVTKTNAEGKVVMTAEAQPVLLYTLCAMFAGAAICGMIDILLFRKMREVIPTVPDKPRQPAIDIRVPYVPGRPFGRITHGAQTLLAVGEQMFVGPMRDSVFRRTLLPVGVMWFAMTVSGAFFYLYLLRSLQFSQTATDMLFMVVGPLMGVLAAKRWGMLLDRWGRRPVMILGMSLTVLSVLPYFFAMPATPNPQFVIDGVNGVAGLVGRIAGRPDWVWLTDEMPIGAWMVMSCSMILGGTGWGGAMLAVNNITLGLADGKGRSKYVAVFTVFFSIGGMLGGLCGGLVARSLREFSFDSNPIDLGYFVFTNWHATFLMSWAARLSTVLLLLRMPDPGSRPLREMLRDLVTHPGQLLRPAPRRRRRTVR